MIRARRCPAPVLNCVHCLLLIVWRLVGGFGFRVVSSNCVRSRQVALDSCGSCVLQCLRMRFVSFICFLDGLLKIYVRDVFWGCGWSVHLGRPCRLQLYSVKVFFCGNVLISVFHFGSFLLFVVICNRSTRPPGGNQVHGLPPALRVPKCINMKNVLGKTAGAAKHNR